MNTLPSFVVRTKFIYQVVDVGFRALAEKNTYVIHRFNVERVIFIPRRGLVILTYFKIVKIG